MSSELQRKLYSMEVEPPAAAWQRLSGILDEINADNRIAAKLEVATIDPGANSWQKISQALYPAPAVRPVIRRLTPYAIAAIMVGLLIGAYFLFFNVQQSGSEVVLTPPPIEKSEPVVAKTTPIDTTRNAVKETVEKPDNISRETYVVNRNQIPKPRNTNPQRNLIASNEPPVSSELEEKIFNQSLDDLSFVASNTGYMTMVNVDGRLVRIPEKYATIAPYLQDKNEYPDYLLDIFMDSKSYWTNQISEWRQKLAESNVPPSYDGFFEFINLLKTIQEN